jgi:membrane protein DedA with SNARE-associated domain
MGPAQIERAERWFQRYGERVVLFGRMIPLIRAFVSLPAGVARMPIVRFTVLTLIGSIPWVLALAIAGHAVGSDWTSVRRGFEYVDYALLALIVIAVLYVGARRRRGAPAEALPAEALAVQTEALAVQTEALPMQTEALPVQVDGGPSSPDAG